MKTLLPLPRRPLVQEPKLERSVPYERKFGSERTNTGISLDSAKFHENRENTNCLSRPRSVRLLRDMTSAKSILSASTHKHDEDMRESEKFIPFDEFSDEIELLRKCFREIDTDNDGVITRLELEAAIKLYADQAEVADNLGRSPSADAEESLQLDFEGFKNAVEKLPRVRGQRVQWASKLGLDAALARHIKVGTLFDGLRGLRDMSEDDVKAACAKFCKDVSVIVLSHWAAACLTYNHSTRAEEANSKFAMTDGAYIGKFGTLEDFYKGPEARIGYPNPKLYEAMQMEHCRRSNAIDCFTTPNYHVNTCPTWEWWWVIDIQRYCPITHTRNRHPSIITAAKGFHSPAGGRITPDNHTAYFDGDGTGSEPRRFPGEVGDAYRETSVTCIFRGATPPLALERACRCQAYLESCQLPHLGIQSRRAAELVGPAMRAVLDSDEQVSRGASLTSPAVVAGDGSARLVVTMPFGRRHLLGEKGEKLRAVLAAAAAGTLDSGGAKSPGAKRGGDEAAEGAAKHLGSWIECTGKAAGIGQPSGVTWEARAAGSGKEMEMRAQEEEVVFGEITETEWVYSEHVHEAEVRREASKRLVSCTAGVPARATTRTAFVAGDAGAAVASTTTRAGREVLIERMVEKFQRETEEMRARGQRRRQGRRRQAETIREFAALPEVRATAERAGLIEEEVIALRLYTGPMYVLYNARLRGFPAAAVEALNGNRYETTLFVITSAVTKLAKVTPIPPSRRLYRGLGGALLPEQFWRSAAAGDDATGGAFQGGVELGLMSTTTERATAVQYSGIHQRRGILFEIEAGRIDVGGSLGFLSQYPGEEEFLMNPLSCLEVIGKPRVEVAPDGGELLVFPMRVNVNLKGVTVEELLQRRKALHLSMAKNLREELLQAARAATDDIVALEARRARGALELVAMAQPLLENKDTGSGGANRSELDDSEGSRRLSMVIIDGGGESWGGGGGGSRDWRVDASMSYGTVEFAAPANGPVATVGAPYMAVAAGKVYYEVEILSPPALAEDLGDESGNWVEPPSAELERNSSDNVDSEENDEFEWGSGTQDERDGQNRVKPVEGRGAGVSVGFTGCVDEATLMWSVNSAGFRCRAWDRCSASGRKQVYEQWGAAWKQGDVIGVACDLDCGDLRVSVNGVFAPDGGIAFAEEVQPGPEVGHRLFPAITGWSIRIGYNLGPDRPFRFSPPSAEYVSIAAAAAALDVEEVGNEVRS